MKLSKQEFSQELHSCGDESKDAMLSVEIMDGGGGEYVVINAVEWAVDSIEEVEEMAAKIKAMLTNPLNHPLTAEVIPGLRGKWDFVVGAGDNKPSNLYCHKCGAEQQLNEKWTVDKNSGRILCPVCF